MKIDLQLFYDYFFGKRAKVPDAVEATPEAAAAQRRHKVETLQEKYKRESETFFFGNESRKIPPIVSSDKREGFRLALRALKASDLEAALYGNNTDKLTGDEYPFPADTQIENRFQRFEEEYFHYFGKESQKEALEKFKAFFKVCKLIGDFVECNNDADNGDSVAYLHAYKMLVLFGDFKSFNDYLKKFFGNAASPVHDALVLNIPTNSATGIDLSKWRGIIMQSSMRACRLFQRAPAIEEKLGRAPATYNEASEAALSISYPGAKEYPALAELCMQYNVNPETFTQCLDVEKKRKSADNLPSTVIKGSDAGKPGYYLVKLPVDDPRAYILGQVTNCCQSMGGHSEACVIDGVTRPNNGFYVLLKQTTKGGEKSPLVNGHIDYHNFEIAGQGYAWLSEMDNLTIDSWENLRPEPDDAVIVPLLEKFAQEITTQRGEREILRVTIGHGGKTPACWTHQIGLTNPEVMREGTQYSDSKSQALVYCNELRHKEILNDLKKILKDDIRMPDEQINRLIWKKYIYSVRLAAQIASLLQKAPIKDYLQVSDNLNQLCEAIESKGGIIWSELTLLDLAGILTEDNFEAIVSNAQYADKIGSALIELHKAGILTPENRQAIVEHVGDAHIISSALIELNKASILTEDNFKAIVSNAHYSNEIGFALIALNKAEILTSENRQVIVEHVWDAHVISSALIELHKAGILTPENRQAIVLNAQYANNIRSILINLNNASLLTEDNFKAIVLNAQYANDIRSILINLNNASLLTEDNFKAIVSNAQYSHAIGFALIALNEAEILTSENRQVIVSNAEDAFYIARELIEAKNARPAVAASVSKIGVFGQPAVQTDETQPGQEKQDKPTQKAP